MNLFNINYKKLTALLLPTFLRKPVIISLLEIVATELGNARGTYYRFEAQRNENLFYLRYTGQVCLLRAALNKHFLIERREDGFEIEGDVSLGNWLYAYRENDDYHDFAKILLPFESATAEAGSAVEPIYVYREKDIEAITTGFTVLYPLEAVSYIDKIDSREDKEPYDRMVNLVDYFRLASRIPEYKPKPTPQNDLTV